MLPHLGPPMTSSFERRYQAFISSTYTDLREERQAVMQSILEVDCFPAGMELFPAADDTAWDYVKTVIQESDYYVVVVGARYGSRDDNGLSFTEREYDYAIELGKPVLAFLHADPNSIPIGKADLSDADREALAAFRAKARRKLCDHWSTSAELRAKVLASLIRLKKRHPSGGWVRAGEIPAAQLELELERSRRELAEVRVELQSLQDGLRQQTRHAQSSPARGWGESTTLDCETTEMSGEVKTQRIETTWDALFLYIGPRMAESPVTPATFRTRISKLCVEASRLEQSEKCLATQRTVDRVAWQLRALGVIDLSQGYWRLTEEGIEELDKLLVEGIETHVSES